MISKTTIPRRFHRISAVAVAWLICSLPLVATGGQLSDVKKSASGGSSSSSSGDNHGSGSRRHGSGSSSSSSDGGLLSSIVSSVLSSDSDSNHEPRRRKRDKRRHNHHDGTSIGFSIEADSDCETCDVDPPYERVEFINRTFPFFPHYPYDDVPGYIVFEPNYIQPRVRTASGRFSAEYGDGFDDVSNIGGHLWLTTSGGFGIDTEFNHRIEDLAGGGHDNLWTGDFNFTYRFIETEHLVVRTGLGWNWLDGPLSEVNGINWTVGAEWYPCNPLVFSAEMDLGRLGSSTLFHGRVTGGVVYKRVEIFAGYDYWDVGDVAIDGVIFGAKIYF